MYRTLQTAPIRGSLITRAADPTRVCPVSVLSSTLVICTPPLHMGKCGWIGPKTVVFAGLAVFSFFFCSSFVFVFLISVFPFLSSVLRSLSSVFSISPPPALLQVFSHLPSPRSFPPPWGQQPRAGKDSLAPTCSPAFRVSRCNAEFRMTTLLFIFLCSLFPPSPSPRLLPTVIQSASLGCNIASTTSDDQATSRTLSPRVLSGQSNPSLVKVCKLQFAPLSSLVALQSPCSLQSPPIHQQIYISAMWQAC